MRKSAGYPAHAHVHAGARPLGSLGLGLYIAPEIVTAHGGTIKVRSDDQETVGASATLSRSKILCSSAGSIGVPVFLTSNAISVSASVITTCTGVSCAPA